MVAWNYSNNSLNISQNNPYSISNLTYDSSPNYVFNTSPYLFGYVTSTTGVNNSSLVNVNFSDVTTSSYTMNIVNNDVSNLTGINVSLLALGPPPSPY